MQHRLRAGRLHRLHAGVYAVGHPAVTKHGRWMAAVLACGRGSLLSHRCAAGLWGIRPANRSAIDVTTPHGTRRPRPGIDLHRTRRLDPEERATEDGIPVTSVTRTLLDLAEVARADDLERALEAAERLQFLDLREMHATLDRNPGRHALKPLRSALEAYRPIPHTRSELERLFLALCRHAGLPPPAANAVVAGLEVDALWRVERLVVELDGRSFHDTHKAFERDRARDTTLQLAGYRVMRVTYRRLTREPEAVAQDVKALLAGSRGRAARGAAVGEAEAKRAGRYAAGR